jgi:glutathione S-transferase
MTTNNNKAKAKELKQHIQTNNDIVYPSGLKLILFIMSIFIGIFLVALVPQSHSQQKMTLTPPSKRQRSSAQESTSEYELLYWPGFPGRGEHIRLLLEEAGAPYLDALSSPLIFSQISDQNVGNAENPPPLAPPILKHGAVLFSQTSNILMYLGQELELAGTVGNLVAPYFINALALTALDGLSNEAHDCHHPISKGAYYEEQVEEARKKSKAYIRDRLPKFLGYFQRVLKGEASGEGPWLYGGMLTYADLVLFQVRVLPVL